MILEAALSWSPLGAEGKVASPNFSPSADCLPRPTNVQEARDNPPVVQALGEPWEVSSVSQPGMVSLLGPPLRAPKEATNPSTAYYSMHPQQRRSCPGWGRCNRLPCSFGRRWLLDKNDKNTFDSAKERLAAIFNQPLEPNVIHALKALADCNIPKLCNKK